MLTVMCIICGYSQAPFPPPPPPPTPHPPQPCGVPIPRLHSQGDRYSAWGWSVSLSADPADRLDTERGI